MSVIHCLKNNLPFFLKRCFKNAKLPHRLFASATPRIKYQENSKILDYYIKKVEPIPEFSMVAVHLHSPSTGAEHLHLACDDRNNLFSVCFRTPPPDSSGPAHILEHTALCGSRRFPCRDPFFNMLGRSMATFMNAFTGSDLTIYAFSTQNEKDFENLFSVYMDAAFYPSLNEKDFKQEGWRLEHEDVNDRSSPIVIKGVVFNEMKGVFSDPNQFYARHLQNGLFPSNAYRHESGGDPLHIPRLTWQGLRDFHDRFYSPANSRFVTYGHLPLETHLERIQSHIVGRSVTDGRTDSRVPDVERWTEPREVLIHNRSDPMAAHPDKQTVVSQSYVLSRITASRETFSLSLLGSLLVDGPSAPFDRNLLQAGIGPDYSPGTGFDANLRESVFSVGLREVGDSDVEVVKRTIEETFDQVIRSGFPPEQVESVLHRIELATRHRTTNFGLNCVLGVSSLWNHGGDPISALRVNDHVTWIRARLREDPRFFQSLVERHFKHNPHRLTLVMRPVENFERELVDGENRLLESLLSGMDEGEKEKVFQEGLELSEYQKHNDVSCLPCLQLEDVPRTVEGTPLQFETCGPASRSAPVQLCAQPTNGLVHFRGLLDASHLTRKQEDLLPLFADIVTQMGAGDRDFLQFDRAAQLTTAGLHVSPHLSTHPARSDAFEQTLLFSSHCLERNVEKMFALWTELFNRVRLEDLPRFSQLVRMRAAELAQAIAHRGHALAMTRAAAALSPAGRARERMHGLTQIEHMKRLAEQESHEDTLQTMKEVAEALFRTRPLRCSLNTTPELMPAARRALDTFLGSVDSSAISSPEEKEKERPFEPRSERTHFVLPFAVNFLGRSVATVPYAHPDYASLKIAAKLLSSKFLHSEIREKGGAYGGGAALNKGGLFMLYSYRDPNVTRTLDTFSAAADWLAQGTYSDQDIVEAKLSVFGEVDSPVAPGARGSLQFLEGVSDAMKAELRTNLLGCSRKDLMDIARKYLGGPSGTALIGPSQTDTADDADWTVVQNRE